MRYQRLNTLIPNEGYDVAWTRMDGRKFHNYLPPDHPLAGQDNFSEGATEEFDWLSRGASIPLSQGVPTATPLLLADNFRNFLLIQNNSSATLPDVAPTLFIGLDGPVAISTIQYAFALAPGVGIVLDTRVPNNSIYAAYSAVSGATTVVGGILTYGRTQNSPPLPPGVAAALQASMLRGVPGWGSGGGSGKGGGGVGIGRAPQLLPGR